MFRVRFPAGFLSFPLISVAFLTVSPWASYCFRAGFLWFQAGFLWRSTHITGPKNHALKIEGKWFHYHGPLQFEIPGLASCRLHGGTARTRNTRRWQFTGLAAIRAETGSQFFRELDPVFLHFRHHFRSSFSHQIWCKKLNREIADPL